MSSESGNSTHTRSTTRPLSVTLLAFGVLTIAGLSFTRFVEAVIFRDFLSGFPTMPVLYLALSGLFWGTTALPLLWGLWSGWRWTPRYTIIYALACTVYYWADRLISEAQSPERNFPFAAGINLLLLLIIGWILTRRSARSFFGVPNERRLKNNPTS